MAEETTETTEETNETQPVFFDSYADDLKAHPGMEKFKDKNQDDVARSYLELQSKFGHDKMVIPKAGDAEGLKQALSSLGLPETSEGYPLSEENLPEGLDIAAYKELALKAGLIPSQAVTLWDELASMTRNGQEQYAEAQKKEFGEKSKALRELLGGKYDESVDLAGRVADKFTADESEGKQVRDLLNANPALLRAFAQIGSSLSENSIGDFKRTSFTLNPQEASDKINQIRNDKNHAYHSDNPKIQQTGQDEMDMLYRMKNRIK